MPFKNANSKFSKNLYSKFEKVEDLPPKKKIENSFKKENEIEE